MRKIAVILILGLLLGSLLPTILISNNIESVNLEDTSLSERAYIPHAIIRIDNNTDFANQASSEGWAGDGSSGNPYIIINYDIDAKGAGNAIYLGNTTVYFKVDGCYLHNSSYHSNPYYDGTGITFNNVQNGMLLNSTSSYNENYGVFMTQSSNNKISNNSVSTNNQKGIYLVSYSMNNEISNNQASYNNNYGIEIYYSNGNTISNNTAIVNHYGIYVYNSKDTIISNNTLDNEYYYDIDISYSVNNTLKNNTMSGNGIYIDGDSLEYWNTHIINTSNTVIPAETKWPSNLIFLWSRLSKLSISYGNT